MERTKENTPSFYYAIAKMDGFCNQILSLYDKVSAYAKLLHEPDKITKDDPIWEFIDEPYEYYQCNQNETRLLEHLRALHKEQAG